jgi:hypothetical protein
MKLCRPDIPVARRDFTATRAPSAPRLRNPGVLFNTTVAVFRLSLGTSRVLGQWPRGIGFCLIRQSSVVPIVCFINQGKFPRTKERVQATQQY